MTDREPIDLEEFEQKLSEKRLKSQVKQAEIVDIGTTFENIGKQPARNALSVTFESVSGEQIEDVIGMPTEYKPSKSDLATMLEFTGVSPNDLRELEGKRVPMEDGLPQYRVMRNVLANEPSTGSGWDAEKRLERADELMEDD